MGRFYGVMLASRMVALRSCFLSRCRPSVDWGKSMVRVGDFLNLGLCSAAFIAKNAFFGI